MTTLLTADQLELGRDLPLKFGQLEGFVPGEGAPDPLFVVVSEAPGKVEARVGHPFQGPAGTTLDQWFAQLGVTRDQLYLTGAVRSRPYTVGPTGLKRDRKPTQAEVIASAPLLDAELQLLAGHLLVPLGNTGLQRLLGSATKIGTVHGQLLERPIRYWDADSARFKLTATTYPIFPLFHPSYARRFKKVRPMVTADLAALKAYLTAHQA
ncbi:uracil-DNA glycosylase [Levilactobacillus namurensis]|nr:uracil-DNA glycosylase [Levilactobacillus namurensis]GEO73596.1 uracil-DNA glycosylase [Levilactobacillus namurensis]